MEDKKLNLKLTGRESGTCVHSPSHEQLKLVPEDLANLVNFEHLDQLDLRRNFSLFKVLRRRNATLGLFFLVIQNIVLQFIVF